jgi:hypothetical protein
MNDEFNELKQVVEALQKDVISLNQFFNHLIEQIPSLDKLIKLYEMHEKEARFRCLMDFFADKEASQKLMDYVDLTPNIKEQLDVLSKADICKLAQTEIFNFKNGIESTKKHIQESSIKSTKELAKEANKVILQTEAELRAVSDKVKSESNETIKQHKVALEKLITHKISLLNNQIRSQRKPNKSAIQQIVDLKVSVYPPDISSKYIKKLLSHLGSVKLNLVEIELKKIGYTKYKQYPANGPEEFRYGYRFTCSKNEYKPIKNETWIVSRVCGSFRKEGMHLSDKSMNKALEYARKLNLKYSATPKQIADVLSHLKYSTYPKNITAKELDAFEIPVSQKDLSKIGYVEYATNCRTKQVIYRHHEFMKSINSGISIGVNGH